MADLTFRNLLSVPAFRYFHEVAQMGSFRKAGESLGIAPSAVHRQVALLEANLGTLLFERQRGRKGVKLSAAGEVLKLRMGQVVSEISKAMEEIQALSDVQRGRVSIGVNDTLAGDVLNALITSYHREAPRLDYVVQIGSSPDLVEALLNGDIDAILCFGLPMRLGIRAIWQRKMETIILAHKGHPLAQKRSATSGLNSSECAQPNCFITRTGKWRSKTGCSRGL